VGAAAGQINLPQLYSYIGNDLHSGVSELMATCAYRSFRSAAWSSRRSSDLARFVPRRVAGVRRYARRHWGPGQGRCSRARMLVWRWWIYRYFSDFVGGMRWFLIQCNTGTFPGRRATATCALLRATGLFIDSQSLVGDGASLDLAMVEARRLFQCLSWRCWSLAAVSNFSECRKA
jgi:hypothetical protein